MKRVISLMSAAAIVLAAVGVYAQAKPSFAGKWTIDAASAPAPGRGGGRGGRGGGGMLGPELTITQDAAVLTIEYAGGGQNPAPVKLTYKLDGTPSSNSVMMRGESAAQVSKAAWEGSALVITTTTPNGNQKRTLALEGANLKVTTTNPGNPNFGDGQPTTNTITYHKAM